MGVFSITPNRVVFRAGEPDVKDMLGLNAEIDEDMRKGWRKLCINDKFHAARKTGWSE
jgi:hypothetical protein